MARTPSKPTDDLVTEGQKNDPAVPAALDKTGDQLSAPGEAIPGEHILKVRATGAHLVFDPYTLDSVGEAGGEMRDTHFVREKIKAGLLEEM